MPKVTINEIDQSRYLQSGTSAPMVVLVPGTASFGPEFDELNSTVHTFSGIAGLQQFYRTFGYAPAKIEKGTYLSTLDNDVSFEYVTNLLASGATVNFVRINKGTQAKSIVGENSLDNIGTEQINLYARYSGRFGNYLVVKPIKILKGNNNPATDIVLTVYSQYGVGNKPVTDTELLDISKCTQLESLRVSIDPSSKYYANLNAFTYIANISVNTIEAILTSSKDAYILEGGLDFCAYNPDSSGATTAAEDKAPMSTLLKNLPDVYKNFTDPYIFDFDFVTSGGFVTKYDPYATTEDNTWAISNFNIDSIHKAMLELCETRGDCVALIDTPRVMPANEVSDYASKLETSYGAIYAPWASVASASTGNTIDMPPSYLFLMAILRGMANNNSTDLWYVPAGVTRAAAPFIVSPQYEIGSVILDEFQNKYNYRVNPIMKVRNYGYCVYGNSTCLQSIDGVGRSALESMNVRLICNVIKKAIFAICSSLAFEYNDSRLWTSFYSQMDKVLIYMKRNYGLYDYKIIMDGTTVTSEAIHERRVPGKIMISPSLAGEFFDIDFEIAPSGVSFSGEA